MLILLILLSVMAVLLASNTVVLRRLHVELQLLEQKQKRALQERLAFGDAAVKHPGRRPEP